MACDHLDRCWVFFTRYTSLMFKEVQIHVQMFNADWRHVSEMAWWLKVLLLQFWLCVVCTKNYIPQQATDTWSKLSAALPMNRSIKVINHRLNLQKAEILCCTASDQVWLSLTATRWHHVNHSIDPRKSTTDLILGFLWKNTQLK